MWIALSGHDPNYKIAIGNDSNQPFVALAQNHGKDTHVVLPDDFRNDRIARKAAHRVLGHNVTALPRHDTRDVQLRFAVILISGHTTLALPPGSGRHDRRITGRKHPDIG
jgi:hypothetical protein